MAQAAQVSLVGRTRRQASPERWQRALQRALFAGVEAKQIAGSGEWIVSSACRPGVAYRTDGVACDCEAAMLAAIRCACTAPPTGTRGAVGVGPGAGAPAPAAVVVCFRCRGMEAGCPVCQGAGVASLPGSGCRAGGRRLRHSAGVAVPSGARACKALAGHRGRRVRSYRHGGREAPWGSSSTPISTAGTTRDISLAQGRPLGMPVHAAQRQGQECLWKDPAGCARQDGGSPRQSEEGHRPQGRAANPRRIHYDWIDRDSRSEATAIDHQELRVYIRLHIAPALGDTTLGD